MDKALQNLYLSYKKFLSFGRSIETFSSHDYQRVRLINLITLILLIAAVSLLIICGSMNTIGLKPALVFSIIFSLFNVTGLKYFKKIHLFSHLTLINMLVTVSICSIIIGGVQASIIIWFAAISVIAAILAKRAVIAYLCASIAVIFIIIFFNEHQYIPENPISSFKLKLLEFFSILFALIAIGIAILSLVFEQDNYAAFLKKVNTALDKANTKLDYLAHHDELTKLANRAQFKKKIRQLSSTENKKDIIHIAYIDLDNMKSINDNYGHDIGDKVLFTLGKRLRNGFKKGDLVARIGGDEFVVVMKNIDSEQSFVTIIERVIQRSQKPLIIDKKIMVDTSVSVGIASYPSDDHSLNGVLKKADKALYRAKNSGKNKLVLYKNIKNSPAR